MRHRYARSMLFQLLSSLDENKQVATQQVQYSIFSRLARQLKKSQLYRLKKILCYHKDFISLSKYQMTSLISVQMNKTTQLRLWLWLMCKYIPTYFIVVKICALMALFQFKMPFHHFMIAGIIFEKLLQILNTAIQCRVAVLNLCV